MLFRSDAVPIAAYALVQQARRARAPMSRDGLEHAIAMTREALEIAPEYVDAWTELAYANWLMWDIRYDPAPARREAAEAASARAVELDPRLSDARYLLAALYRQMGDRAAAERELEVFAVLETIPEGKSGY